MSHPPTEEGAPHPPTVAAGPGSTDAAAHTATAGSGDGAGLGRTASASGPAAVNLRFGPGVPSAAPANLGGKTAEEVWRSGPSPVPPRRPSRRLRRAASGAITVALLVAAGVVLFLRLHHDPLTVTGTAITGQVKSGCSVDVTGRITTNGSAGTVSYQWLFQPQTQAPQPLSQSVTSGQDAVYVTVAVQGDGQGGTVQGTAVQEITLRVLGPGTGSASVRVVLSC